jgi:hypothetical protein
LVITKDFISTEVKELQTNCEIVWQKFKKGDNSTYTFTKKGGGMYLVSATPAKLLIEFL